MKSVTTLKKKKKKEDKVPSTTSEINFEVATSNVTFCKMPQYTWSAKIRSTLMKHAEGVSSHHILHSQHTVQNAFASGNVDYSLENIYLGLGLFFDSFVSINRPGQVCNGYL